MAPQSRSLSTILRRNESWHVSSSFTTCILFENSDGQKVLNLGFMLALTGWKWINIWNQPESFHPPGPHTLSLGPAVDATFTEFDLLVSYLGPEEQISQRTTEATLWNQRLYDHGLLGDGERKLTLSVYFKLF